MRSSGGCPGPDKVWCPCSGVSQDTSPFLPITQKNSAVRLLSVCKFYKAADGLMWLAQNLDTLAEALSQGLK